MSMHTPPSSPGGRDWGDVILVALLVQAASSLVAALGFVMVALFMGTLPAFAGYALLVVGRPLLLIGLAPGTARGRRWQRRAVLAIEYMTLAGFALNLLLGLLPQLGTQVTLVSLLTNVALPAAVIVLLWRGRAGSKTKVRMDHSPADRVSRERGRLAHPWKRTGAGETPALPRAS
jgi:hypothetical protein